MALYAPSAALLSVCERPRRHGTYAPTTERLPLGDENNSDRLLGVLHDLLTRDLGISADDYNAALSRFAEEVWKRAHAVRGEILRGDAMPTKRFIATLTGRGFSDVCTDDTAVTAGYQLLSAFAYSGCELYRQGVAWPVYSAGLDPRLESAMIIVGKDCVEVATTIHSENG